MCFTLGFIENLLIWLVIICLVVACVRLLVPFICSKFGVEIPGVVMQLFGFLIWAAILIFAIIVIFDLIACITGGSSLHFGALPRS